MNIGGLKNETGKIVMWNKEMAEELKNLYQFSQWKTPAYQNFNRIRAEVSVQAITKDKVLEKLKRLKVDKSAGPDGLHPRVVKEIAEEFVEALVIIFQELL
eukprot:g40197.t1